MTCLKVTTLQNHPHPSYKVLNYCRKNAKRLRTRLSTLERQIDSDSLTALFNMGKLKSTLQELEEQDQCISLLLLNLDGFGRINNAYGIDAGDKVLVECARMLSQNIPPNGMLFRLSGDEFAIILTKPSVDQDVALAQQLLGFFCQSYIEINELEIKLTFSIGIAQGTGVQALKRAFLALLECRQYGRNRFSVYKKDSQIEQRLENNFYWQSKIRDALVDGRLIPYLQPIINNRNGKIEKFECLIRLIEDGIVIPPLAFLESAKESGILSSVTRQILSDSFKIFSKNSFDFSLNITEDDLIDDGFVDFIRHKLDVHGIEPSRVYFEILEGISTSQALQSLNMLQRIKALGCKITVDDFGTEHSNFARLLELQVDVIKIDGCFIKNIDSDEKSQKIATAIIDFAHSIGAKVVAEYVHSKEVFHKVIELGVDYSQGYFLGEPKSADSQALTHRFTKVSQ